MPIRSISPACWCWSASILSAISAWAPSAGSISAGLNIQPSEFMKLAVILVLARYFHQLHPEDIQRFPFLIPPVLLIIVPGGADLAPAQSRDDHDHGFGRRHHCVFWRVCAGGILSGSRRRAFAAAPVAWHFMHDYQKRRVLTFLDPPQDPLGAGYNILQSMIAIGSGGLFGKGYLQGSQNQLNFLPEKHTDFIFTMLAEEFGFLGGCCCSGLYAVAAGAGMMVAMRSRSTFGALIAAGVVALIFMHILINCAMVMGMIPVVGVPLPLMSYGGSIMVSTVLAVGLLLNAYAHRDQCRCA